MNKSLFSILGFVMFLTGGIAIVLTLVGLRLTILSPLEYFGAGWAFLAKIILMILGIILVYVARTHEED